MASEVIEGASTEVSAPRNGLRGVFLDDSDRAYINVVASPTASYLLPDLLPTLQSISFGAAETGESRGILIVGDSVVVALPVHQKSLHPDRSFHNEQAFDRRSPVTVPETAIALDAPAMQAPASPPTPPSALVVHAPDVGEAFGPLPADAPVQAIASRIRELSGLSDSRLAGIFKVTRETFNRWRSGAMTNPTEGTRRRVVMVLHLLEELAAQEVNINDWLQNPSPANGISPYDLLKRGRIDDAAYAAAAIGQAPLLGRSNIGEEPLVFDDDDEGWESFDLEVADDEG